MVPFTNLTADPANDYLADGIAETLMTMLAQVSELNVIGPASSFSLKGSIEDPRVVGSKLGAGALLAGSVQRDDNHIRVSAQLVGTTDGTQLWAATYDRPEADIFAVQDAIATEVTRALSIALAGKAGLGAIGTQDVAAYDHYLRGKQLIERRVSGSIEDGIAALERSVDLDPTFARAWAELAMGYLLVSTEASRTGATGSRSVGRARDLAKLAAHRAVEIAPDLGAAHTALAQYLELSRSRSGRTGSRGQGRGTEPGRSVVPDRARRHAARLGSTRGGPRTNKARTAARPAQLAAAPERRPHL